MANDGWYPGAVRLPITTNEFFPTRAVPLVSIVDHITDGDDSRDWLQHANNASSVHFLIREESGKGVVYQFMPVERAAWGNGRFSNSNPFMPDWVKSLIARGVNINHATVSIEHERNWPFSTLLAGPMLEASIALHKWLVQNYPTISADRTHIIGHYQIDNDTRANCPGGPGGNLFPFDGIIAAVNGAPSTGTQTIEEYAATHPYVGLPIDDKAVPRVLEDGKTWPLTRLYERALLHQLEAGQPVLEARIGWMWLQELEK